MIALVAGEVVVRRPDHVVIETASGVGYRLNVSAETLKHVPAAGEATSLHTHLVVREDALTLYGFSTEQERDLFLLLLGVQSVGPKVAQAILSAGPPRELLAALATEDAKRFQAAPGVGKRTAERIIVELRDKVGLVADGVGVGGTAGARGAPSDALGLAREGLAELGFAPEEVADLLRGADADTPEGLIAHALKAARG